MSPSTPLGQNAAAVTPYDSRRPAPLTELELAALIASAKGPSFTAVRNRALVALLAGSGAKVGELQDLKERDVDFEVGCLELHDRTGAHFRRVRLLPVAIPHVEAWRQERRTQIALRAPEESRMGPDEQPFFCTRAGGPLEASYLRRLLPRLAKRAGLDRSVNAGLLRSTFAAHVYRLGASLPEIQRLLGHGDARSTLHLVRPVLEDARTREQRPFHPEQWCLPGSA